MKKVVLWIIAFCLLSLSTIFGQVSVNGNLSVSGNKIVNKLNKEVSFAGPSLFWSNWGGKYWNANVVQWVKEDWNATIIRAAMGVEANNGYIADPTPNKDRVKTVVDAAIANDMYVIIDWHSHEAENYQTQAIAFFKEMATLYGDKPNVIYQIYNEPINQSWTTIKNYATAVIDTIRKIDKDNIIMVGTGFYSQKVDEASANPINRSNIAYTLHFYAASHKDSLRKKAQTALNNGVALFVTEWGTCEASGDGTVDESSTNTWMEFLKQNKISHCNWSLFDKNESASALVSNASTAGNWSASDLTTSGILVKNIIKNWSFDQGSGGGTTEPEGTTLIADCEDGATTSAGGTWFSFNDANNNGYSVITPASGSSFTMTAGGANGSANAAVVSYTLDQGSYQRNPFVGFGFSLNSDNSANDLSGSTGVSFYHKGDAFTFQTIVTDVTDYDNYKTEVSAHTDWTLVTIPWTSLSQAGWGTPVTFNAAHITKFQFQKSAATGTTGTISIDEVQIDNLTTSFNEK
jgi:hypothetical protein